MDLRPLRPTYMNLATDKGALKPRSCSPRIISLAGWCHLSEQCNAVGATINAAWWYPRCDLLVGSWLVDWCILSSRIHFGRVKRADLMCKLLVDEVAALLSDSFLLSSFRTNLQLLGTNNMASVGLLRLSVVIVISQCLQWDVGFHLHADWSCSRWPRRVLMQMSCVWTDFSSSTRLPTVSTTIILGSTVWHSLGCCWEWYLRWRRENTTRAEWQSSLLYGSWGTPASLFRHSKLGPSGSLSSRLFHLLTPDSTVRGVIVFFPFSRCNVHVESLRLADCCHERTLRGREQNRQKGQRASATILVWLSGRRTWNDNPWRTLEFLHKLPWIYDR